MTRLRAMSVAVILLLVTAVSLLVVRQYAWAALSSVLLVVSYQVWYRMTAEAVVLMSVAKAGGRINAQKIYVDFPRNGREIVGRLVRKNRLVLDNGVLTIGARSPNMKAT